jgi:hypothetical protein
MSPDSLRRFLVDDEPACLAQLAEERPSVIIPEDIAEEIDDDDNFATSAVSENVSFATSLSPPPFKRCHSDGILTINTSQRAPLTAHSEQHISMKSGSRTSDRSSRPKLSAIDLDCPPSRFSISSDSSLGSPASPSSPAEMQSFFDTDDEDEDEDEDEGLSSNESDRLSFQPLSLPSTRHPSYEQTSTLFTGYSLPETASGQAKNSLDVQPAFASISSPALLARDDSSVAVGSPTLLTAPIDAGLDDFVNELGWMVDVIRGKGN